MGVSLKKQLFFYNFGQPISKGCMVVFFIFIQILIEHSVLNNGEYSDPDQMPHSVESDLGLHCLLMSNKKDARLMG